MASNPREGTSSIFDAVQPAHYEPGYGPANPIGSVKHLEPARSILGPARMVGAGISGLLFRGKESPINTGTVVEGAEIAATIVMVGAYRAIEIVESVQNKKAKPEKGDIAYAAIPSIAGAVILGVGYKVSDEIKDRFKGKRK